ncbi:MAG TPA: hypothetical protein IGS53_13020 [Leptolyngbyaceae cyanobacterium M33_DOE_097]|uniref:DUF1269 domain-containing protein n=1 Tax=Oscillatoriales cyanobacterium SpSt-418 TaxID=2282169 RepID=A0A7C3KFD4_9CYAN|nr:hypothetical protein [Leptolyngbyaceae cyanobacterium M33_DOE_097]
MSEIDTKQSPIGNFSDRAHAEEALSTLRENLELNGNVSVVVQTPPISATKAATSGKRGVITGTLLGAMVGLVFNYMRVNFLEGTSPTPILDAVSIILLGSGVGAAGVGILAAMTGVNVRKETDEPADYAPYYLIMAEETDVEKLSQAKEILKQHGSTI